MYCLRVSLFDGMERWNGTVEWNGMERNGMEWNGTVVGSAHAPIASSFNPASRSLRATCVEVGSFFMILCVGLNRP